MTSRILNIFVIKSRSRPKPTTLPPPFTQFSGASVPRITQYTITLNQTTRVVLRGLSTDLYALTTTVWLRPKTHVEGYLEAMAKMLVYLVAAVSGNATQAGNLILLSLLLASAGLLALSNARITGLRNGGKVVAPPFPGEKKKHGSRGKDGGGGLRDGARSGRANHGQANPPKAAATAAGPKRSYEPRQVVETDSWPETSESSSVAGNEETVKQGRSGNVHRSTYLPDDPVEYELRLEEGLGIPSTKRSSETRRR